jgi:uncharacterized protein YegJ (DUF2314 family)
MAFNSDGLRYAIENEKVQWQKHALERILQRGIKRVDVFKVLRKGDVIEEYLDDKPWPSALFLGWVNNQPLHVVAAYDGNIKKCAIITVYEPSLDYFENDFRTRRKKNV